jgi:hypothetical protein
MRQPIESMARFTRFSMTEAGSNAQSFGEFTTYGHSYAGMCKYCQTSAITEYVLREVTFSAHQISTQFEDILVTHHGKSSLISVIWTTSQENIWDLTIQVIQHQMMSFEDLPILGRPSETAIAFWSWPIKPPYSGTFETQVLFEQWGESAPAEQSHTRCPQSLLL